MCIHYDGVLCDSGSSSLRGAALADRVAAWQAERDGNLVTRADLTINEVSCAVIALSLLYRIDRLALGADLDVQPSPRDRFSEMTDQELEEELARLRKKDLLN